MSLPQELLTTATLGTAQRELSAHDLPLLDQLDATDREKAVLVAAAALTLQSEAGWLIPQDSRPLPEPDEQVSGKTVSDQAIRHLMIMLEGHYANLLPEWLSEAAKCGRRVPEEALPMLLDTGRKRKELREAILPLLGRRGYWLAEQARDKQWGWLLPDNLEKLWEEGNFETRVQVIEEIRKTDPAKGREMIMSIWNTTKALDRQKLLHCLREGLSMEDEPFLESALDDKSAGVQGIAAGMLHWLPESRYHQRMKARALPLVEYYANELDYSLPDHLDSAALRDGFDQDESKDMDVQRHWLQIMLMIVPPAVWREKFNLTPQGLIVAALNSRESRLFLDVWANAAAYVNDAEFAALLLPTLFEVNSNKDSYAAYFLLIQKLPPNVFEQLVLETAEKANSPLHLGLRALLVSKHEPWSERMTRALLDTLRRYLSKGNVRPDPQLRNDLLQYALYIPVSMHEEFIRILSSRTSAEKVWNLMVDEIRLILEFRAEMLTAIYS